MKIAYKKRFEDSFQDLITLIMVLSDHLAWTQEEEDAILDKIYLKYNKKPPLNSLKKVKGGIKSELDILI
jgi:hypothetical protein